VNGGGSVVDGECPSVACDIPEKLVVILVETELARRCVGQRVGVATLRHHRIGTAEVDALAIGIILDAVGFIDRITSRGQHLEIDDITIVEGVLVARGEFAKDAVTDLIAGSKDGDDFGDQDGRVVLESDITVEVEDALGLRRDGVGECQQGRREQEQPDCEAIKHRRPLLQQE
jgi:hypothetical protein